MRRHPGAIKRQQRAMGRARVALRGLRHQAASGFGPSAESGKPETAPPTCDCIASGNALKPKQHGADPHAKNCAVYAPHCGATSHGYVCDREPGHAGNHRSYNEQVDEPVFWTR
jgi:hypothetical protein